MVRNKYRSRLQIIADVLSATEKGAKKTHIMYQANLSYKLLTLYLNRVLEAELIRTVEGSYEITEKGRSFLEKFHEYSQRREQLRERVEGVNDDKLFLENMV